LRQLFNLSDEFESGVKPRFVEKRRMEVLAETDSGGWRDRRGSRFRFYALYRRLFSLALSEEMVPFMVRSPPNVVELGQ